MFTITTIKKIVKPVTSGYRPKRPLIINPRRDWKVLLTGFFLVSAVAIGFSVYVLLKINRGELFRTEPSESATTGSFNRAFLEEVLGRMDERARLFEHYKLYKPNLQDPST